MKWNEVYNIDCMEGLKGMPDNSVDLVITSPPYNIGNFNAAGRDLGTYAGNNMIEEEYQTWQIDLLSEIMRIIKPTGSVFYNHKIRIKDGKAIHPIEWITKTDLILKQEITWNMKRGANTQKIRYFPFSERIYWLTKDASVKAHNELCLTDVWDVPRRVNRKKTGHLAVMPEEVVENILETIPCENVLDPFAGSGTTLKVSRDYGKDFIGFEICPDYHSRILNRLNDK